MGQVDYVHYHMRVIDAEKYIRTQKLDSAIVVYQELGFHYPELFYKDLHNLCLCYLKTNQTKKCQLAAQQLLLQGYTMSDFEEETFAAFRKSGKPWQRFRKNYSKLHGKYVSSLDAAYRDTLYNIFINDQKYANREIIPQDSVFFLQANILYKLFEQKGFHPLGVNKDTLDHKIKVLIRHYFGLYNRVRQNPSMETEMFYNSLDFSKIHMDVVLIDALHRGILLPDYYVDIVTYWEKRDLYGLLSVEIDFEKERISLKLRRTTEGIVEINNHRAAIGLYPINNELSLISSVNDSWSGLYPFQMIKDSLKSCQSCKTPMDYSELMIKLSKDVEEKFTAKNKDGFLLSEPKVNEFWYKGTLRYFTSN